MGHRWWRAVLVLAGLMAVATGLSTEDPTWVTRADHRAVALVTLPCMGTQANSSGFVVADETVLTVAHALYESREFALRDYRGRWHRGEIVHLDLERDLAIVHVEGLRAVGVEIAPRRPADAWPQARVRMVGGAASGSANATIVRRVRATTEVIGNRDETTSRSSYELALDIGPGDSGAGLVDDHERLVALVFARSTGRDGVSWATAVDEVDLAARQLVEWECVPFANARNLDLRPPKPE